MVRDLVMIVVADKPTNESHYYPDGDTYGVRVGDRRVMLRSEGRGDDDCEE